MLEFDKPYRNSSPSSNSWDPSLVFENSLYFLSAFSRMLLHSLFINILLWNLVSSFNYEDRDPLVKNAPAGQKGSYFGFSVAQHSTVELDGNLDNSIDKYWLLVGAPLGKNLQPNTNHSGALFKCPLSSDAECIQVKTDGVEELDYGDKTKSDVVLKAPGPHEIKDGQWLGVTVRSQKPGGVVLVCAHRYIQSPDLRKFHYGKGLCYLLNSQLGINQSVQPCNGRPMERLHQQFGFCQVGTSASFVGDTFAAMGAPGPYTWRGTVFAQDVGDFLERDKTIYHSPFGDIDIIDKYSYLGMSVAGGHLFNKSEYTFISGAPRSKMVGEVFLFKKYGHDEEFNVTLNITGEQFASSFGYEVLAADVNNDGYDDLLVGAPFYYGDNKGGAVYVYYRVRDCKPGNCSYSQALYGRPQSRFGFSMALLGDINKDGYNDVAVGAPYEDEHGAVYIYLGSANGLNDEPSQVIRKTQVKTLGYSLSGGMDMDNNGYPDLLVGAFESDLVLLFKTRPIIDIKIDIISNELKNINATKRGCIASPQNNLTCFSFQSCFTIVGKPKNSEDFQVIYNVAEENRFVSRVWFVDSTHPNKHSSYMKKIINVTGNSQRYCQEELVNIIEGVSDILSPIKFRVNYMLENNKYHTPILNKTSVKLFEARFQKDCGNDDICESNLTLSAGTNLTVNNSGVYQVDGINEDFILDVNITNSGDSAYETKLFIFHPNALSYVPLKSDNDVPSNVKCSYINVTLVVCDVGNPFQGALNLKIRFEILKDTKETILLLNLFVNSTSTELSKETSQKVVAVLQKIAKFHINGKASTNLFYGGKITGESAVHHLEDIGARVMHKYQIDNEGSWDLSKVKVNIKWPIQVTPGPKQTDNRPGKWLLYLESIPKVYGVGIDGHCQVLDRTKINELQFEISSTDTSHVRRKRSINYVVPFETTEKGGKKRKIVSLDCVSQTALCIDITCNITELNIGDIAEIYIISRIWNSTLVEDYSNVDWVVIRSNAVVEIPDKSFKISPEAVQFFSAQTIAYPEIVSTDSELNWVIIGGAVLAGLLLLIVLIIILCKCGFFKRNRPSDHTLSGNLQKKEEADHLLNNKSN
ncbi:unnamed protein product [Phaedon cochleariae]|uniref:Uncharacterized protein n=1 Tax=Phaedon cochleariae TaxID=80249 RepID=A0A9N9X5E6_PHACE|nr:unnamed protein product [Phaedon cochleariae]